MNSYFEFIKDNFNYIFIFFLIIYYILYNLNISDSGLLKVFAIIICISLMIYLKKEDFDTSKKNNNKYSHIINNLDKKNKYLLSNFIAVKLFEKLLPFKKSNTTEFDNSVKNVNEILKLRNETLNTRKIINFNNILDIMKTLKIDTMNSLKNLEINMNNEEINNYAKLLIFLNSFLESCIIDIKNLINYLWDNGIVHNNISPIKETIEPNPTNLESYSQNYSIYN